MTQSHADQTRLWKAFSRAIDAEYRSDTVIRGISGLEHEVQAIAVDDKTNRVIVVSAEPNPRMAAMMQVDVQQTMRTSSVVVARPISFDLSGLARKILEPIGIHEVEIQKARRFFDELKDKSEGEETDWVSDDHQATLNNAMEVIQRADLPAIPQIMSAISQLSILPWTEIMALLSETAESGTLNLKSFLAKDSIAEDLSVGVCPIPLFNFSENDFELFFRGNEHDAIRNRLIELGIYQYFFPPADQLALGLVDQGISDQQDVIEATRKLPETGHPFGRLELVDNFNDLPELVEQMKAKGYVVEGEFGLEVSENGNTIRKTVKYKPRESLITKVINRISLNASISPSDFVK